MTTLRKTPALSNNGGLKVNDDTYAEEVNANVVALWPRVICWLVSIAGTGNAITAATDTAGSGGAIITYIRPMAFWYKAVAANTTSVTINIDTIGVKNVLDQFGVALQGGEFVIGGTYLLVFDGTEFLAYGVTAGSIALPSTAPNLIANEQQTSGTAGGTFTSGAYRQRNLNTLVRNSIGASLTSNQITLLAGTYYATWRCPGFQVGQHKSRLQNITDSTTITLGSNIRSSNDQGDSVGSAYFTISATKVIQLEHRSSGTQNTNGFGIACTFGDNEIYSEIRIWKQ